MEYIYKYPIHVRMVPMIGICLSLTALGLNFFFLIQASIGVQLFIAAPLTILFLYSMRLVLRYNNRYVLAQDKLIRNLFFRKEDMLYKKIQALENIPSLGILDVRSNQDRFRIHRNLKDFTILEDNLRRVLLENEGWKHYSPPFVVSRERSSYLVYVSLLGMTLWFSIRMVQYLLAVQEQAIGALTVQSLFIAFLAYLIFRILFIVPRQYVFLKQQIRVRFALGEKVYLIKDLEEIQISYYYTRGALMHRIRLKFQEAHLDLDEVFLKVSYGEILEFLKANYLVPIIK